MDILSRVLAFLVPSLFIQGRLFSSAIYESLKKYENKTKHDNTATVRGMALISLQQLYVEWH